VPKLPEIVTKKIGPLPLWSYVVIGGVLVFILRARAGGSGATSNPAGTISVPSLTPGTPTDSLGGGAGAVGSPAQNSTAGTDTQPGGVAPWWSIPPDWFAAGPGGGANPALSGGGGGNTGAQSNAFAGLTPKMSVLGQTADVLSREPVGGWKLPPIFQRLSPTAVRDTSGQNTGTVDPGNRLLGYSDPVTGSLSQTPNGGPAIWR
jgi:hypothetical protein